MIEDSLDNQVDESLYHLPEIEKLLLAIGEESVTPEEMAKMIDESYIAEAEKRGRNEGIEQGKLETAKALLAMGLDIESIVKATGLTEEMILQ